ncbi:MAG: hypothetical protein QF486_04760 [Candidatus Woesearchaeota archaeon]|jgi:Na+-transporting NADH:ubiquinone oxidoreductase subunit NqrB|nr:hypothetical protein [Candidatus Woesearchaeota archaeon]MDP7198902.1 hypothetical protein [Candidatus Woesearchaeota archaeon]MDP7647780.1 hypothetical protein [Candidatus Woesearchaeota archaeon]
MWEHYAKEAAYSVVASLAVFFVLSGRESPKLYAKIIVVALAAFLVAQGIAFGMLFAGNHPFVVDYIDPGMYYTTLVLVPFLLTKYWLHLPGWKALLLGVACGLAPVIPQLIGRR